MAVESPPPRERLITITQSAGGNGAAGALGALNGVAGSGNDPVGGGGGGGAGRIRINLPLGTTFAPAGTISPAPSIGTLATR